MKTGKISNKDKEFILKNKSKGTAYLSKKLDRTEATIQKFLDSETEKEQEVVVEEKKKAASVAPLFGKTKNALVMTPALSETIDELNKKYPKIRYDESCIVKIIKD